MNQHPLSSLDKLEADLWEAADQLRANSKLTSSEYCMPVLGIIFLRHAANRFEAATRQIQEDQATGRMSKRPVNRADYLKRRALWLPEGARYDQIVALPNEADLGQALVAAMNAIEADFEPLQGVLPKDYGIFESRVLEDLLRIFNRDALRDAGGDLFGRIYEYFLMKFAMEGAQDKGEFFTPPSLVQTIVNVIEPDHGIVFDPACGSGGMFVQTSHFIERMGQDTSHRVTFYGQEKTATTIKLAVMNLAVHGLEGDIREANTFYEDVHTLAGKCDFVMANPPFNVDMVAAENLTGDPRLPFGLPGVNKQKKVSNGNYLWISFFWGYLNERGRAGFVMSSQASSAGHGERDVRRKIVETGDVDVMISIRSNFFYTRTVPCELWFFDRGKPDHRRDKVLMIDARNIYRKVTRKIYDFSPEQLRNIAAIVWLYRGKRGRFLELVREYLASLCDQCAAIPTNLKRFEDTLHELRERLGSLADVAKNLQDLAPDQKQSFLDGGLELDNAVRTYEADSRALLDELSAYRASICDALPASNEEQQVGRRAFEPLAERIKGLGKQIDLLYKLATRWIDLAGQLARDDRAAEAYDRKAAARLARQLDSQRTEAIEPLKQATYFHKQVAWLQERFPEAELRDVPGLVKLVARSEIESSDWSLTPGRYVGVAPPEPDDGFDFGEALRDIHLELKSLNEEAAKLAQKIQRNFERLGI
jgi:type I restriction enzyme M protein